MSPTPTSVVIPTRDRPGPLARCLAALDAQQGVELEVVVVDDGSRDPGAVRQVVSAHEGARLLRLEGRGPAAARNAGIREATGEILLLTDDDCVPSPGWAKGMADEVARTGALVVGRTVHDPRRHLVAASETIVLHAERRHRFAATRNVGIPRKLALAVPFDERFREAGGEDREWCRRLTERGTSLFEVESAVLVHEPELDLRRFWRQQLRYGRAARTDGAPLSTGARSCCQVVVAGFRRGAVTGGLVTLAQLATVVGYALRPRA